MTLAFADFADADGNDPCGTGFEIIEDTHQTLNRAMVDGDKRMPAPGDVT